MQIGNLKIPHCLIMAPMCGITHKAFRKMIKGYGGGLVMTQMVSAKAITMGDAKSRKLLEFDESERPVGFQVFGNNADTLAEAAGIMQELGPDLIDLNMGCPAKKIVDDGGGSALLRNENLAREIFVKMRKILKIPFTVKMRSGWDREFEDAIRIAQIAQDSGVDAVALHARTRAQGYSGKANWDLIRDFKRELSIPVIGNGDVETIADASRMLSETGCDAVMVGRAAVSEPWFFKSYLDQKEYQPSSGEIRDLILSQYEEFFRYFGQPTGIKQMRKHLCAYTKGVRDGSVFRNKIISMEEWGPLREEVVRFFSA
ncbi:MAG: tRNA dihydrouridine synthase DusB [Deltaproteobacteria bacterium]|nr:tRNA dihydrouridine synthase DusB [Deltaproteobacteria bacterium]